MELCEYWDFMTTEVMPAMVMSRQTGAVGQQLADGHAERDGPLPGHLPRLGGLLHQHERISATRERRKNAL